MVPPQSSFLGLWLVCCWKSLATSTVLILQVNPPNYGAEDIESLPAYIMDNSGARVRFGKYLIYCIQRKNLVFVRNFDLFSMNHSLELPAPVNVHDGAQQTNR